MIKINKKASNSKIIWNSFLNKKRIKSIIKNYSKDPKEGTKKFGEILSKVKR